MDEKILKTGTTTVGLVCKDGIVLAADKRVTAAGQIVMNKYFNKIVEITDKLAVTTAGSVSDIQLIVKLIKAQLRLNKIRTNRDPSVKETANLLASIIYGNIRSFSAIPSITGFLLGGIDNSGFYLYNLGIAGDIILSRDYEADGSGMMYALGVLEITYKKDLSLNEGVKLAVKAINAALQRDTATGNGIDVITVTKDGIKRVLEREINTRLTA